MIEIFGTTYYTSWLATILFCLITVIITVIIILGLRLMSARNRPSIKKLLIVFGAFELVIFGILHWDIIVAGHQVSKMCREQGGMHIYKTVAADGMAGMSGIRGWSEYGFSYVEYVDSRGDVIRSTIINGEIVKERVDKITSQYIFKSKRENIAKIVDKSFIKKITLSVMDRDDGNVLGELIYFTIHQGWADHWVPGEYKPWKCCNKGMRNGRSVFLTGSGLIKEVVKPENK
ncbi:hypothetical protein JWJ90_22460 [Desulfobulbus rhabdoformis]|uniref:hypothetical protein n=1 Tax=Desulfobulbus rhabdoformis TaxID=34032 RepID=UPI0019633241|nr:hypothetical protein [Desulfobulbus rhabdoformis]MBM9617026.1 hypothetical protein [Desulfobulbus rhabdoformis]